MAAGNPTDGIRRYEELVAEAKQIANTALAIAMTGSILNTSGVLDIPHGGTGANRKVFVDTYSNQFNIHGSKTFHDSCAFQKESDIVDSQELSGNVRLVTCDPQGADIGPQLRFSGRNTDNDLTVFAFATIAGRKFNSISGDKAGYLQLATANIAGIIAETARIDHQGNMGIGVMPIIDSCNRLSISGGNIFIDYGSDGVGCTGNEVSLFGREYKIQVGAGSHLDVMARFQAVENWFSAAPAKHLFLAVNTRLMNNGLCAVDDLNLSTAGIEIAVDGIAGQINFYTTPPSNTTPACVCPSLRGFFHDGGLDVLGDIIVTPSSQPCGVLQGNIVAGGAKNYPDAALDSSSHRGNCNAGQPGMVAGDNLHWGVGSPEGVVCAPVGAFYGRQDPSTDNEIAYLKSGDHYGPTMWLPIPVGASQTVCVDGGCPDPIKCPYWLDPQTNMMWYWSPNAKPGQTVPGAWLSVQTFNINRAFPIGESGVGHCYAFRGKLNKDYEYLMPLHLGRNKRHPSGRFDIYFTDSSIVWRIRDNGLDPDKNYYILDLVTLKRRQGEPVAGNPVWQEWPNDRDADDNKSNDVKASGHTYHPNLPGSLVLRGLTSSSVAVKWTGVINGLSTSNVNKRVCFSPPALVCKDVNDGVTLCPTYTPDIWTPKLNRATTGTGDNAGVILPINDGFTMKFTGGTVANQGEERFILDSGIDTTFGGYIRVKKNWNAVPQIGDTFEITSSQFRRVLARFTNRGNVYWPNGPYGDNQTHDLQDFAIGTYATTFQANIPGGMAPGQTDPYDPAFAQYMQVAMDYYLPLVTDGTFQTGLDAVMLALLWDSVVAPGKIAGCFNVGYRLAMPSLNGDPC